MPFARGSWAHLKNFVAALGEYVPYLAVIVVACWMWWTKRAPTRIVLSSSTSAANSANLSYLPCRMGLLFSRWLYTTGRSRKKRGLLAQI